ncbi:MAG: hypothetical protein EA347_06875 [Thioalkalivibrio sp.]|nr:MAG: hypothetical protein EA347_06875 [Thioalkalivibrio sp.]
MNTQVQRRGIAGNAARALGVVLALALLTALVMDQRPWDRLLATDSGVGIVIQGQRFQLPAEESAVIEHRAARHADRGAAEAGDAAARLVAAELDDLFERLSGRLPAYADWYFSLRGEYTRLSLLILRWGGLATADPVVDKAVELILGGEELAGEVSAIEGRVEGLLAARASELRTAWLQELLLMAGEPRPASEPGTPSAVVLLDDLAKEFAGHGSSEFLTRLSASSAGAASAGAAGPLAARLALRSSAAAAGGGSLALKGAGRGAAKAGSAGAGALGCAAAGPAAWACALAVGGAAWLATDWALLSADEWRNRDALIADWEARLALLRAELEETLLEHYDEAIAAWHRGMRLEVERSFSPLDSVRGAPPRRSI